MDVHSCTKNVTFACLMLDTQNMPLSNTCGIQNTFYNDNILYLNITEVGHATLLEYTQL